VYDGICKIPRGDDIVAKKRRQFTAEFKARVVRAALKEDKTLAELAAKFGVHPNQITEWKRKILEVLPDMFSRKKQADAKAAEQHEARLYEQIGKLQVDLEWMKKKARQLGIDD
jgi:transposase-like protein